MARGAHSSSASGLAARPPRSPPADRAPRAALPPRGTRLLERLSFAANALPGIVIALALVFFAADYARPLYQSLALLVFAYVVRFFPQALAGIERRSPRSIRASRRRARRSAAARCDRADRDAAARAPRVLAGAALVFLSAMKELPATLLLRPIGFDTLATEIWD